VAEVHKYEAIENLALSGLAFLELTAATQSWLSDEGVQCQKLQTENGGILLQIKRVGEWRIFMGMGTALKIVFHQVGIR
jgi:hypothetical protein